MHEYRRPTLRARARRAHVRGPPHSAPRARAPPPRRTRARARSSQCCPPRSATGRPMSAHSEPMSSLLHARGQAVRARAPACVSTRRRTAHATARRGAPVVQWRSRDHQSRRITTAIHHLEQGLPAMQRAATHHSQLRRHAAHANKCAAPHYKREGGATTSRAASSAAVTRAGVHRHSWTRTRASDTLCRRVSLLRARCASSSRKAPHPISQNAVEFRCFPRVA